VRGRPGLAEKLALMVLTDPACGEGRSVVEVVRASLQGGAPSVQLRAKGESTREMVELGRALKSATEAAGALLLVNDRLDVALAIGADGGHVGDDDLPLQAARAIVPHGFLLGRSVDTPEEAHEAARLGADYVGAGPVLGTPSKRDAAEPIGVHGIGVIALAAQLPVIAIGGVGEENAEEVVRAGADGVAVIRAVMQAGDPAAATRRLLAAVAAGRRGRAAAQSS
jgi:thiamine-phosphate pyrophosphorylase